MQKWNISTSHANYNIKSENNNDPYDLFILDTHTNLNLHFACQNPWKNIFKQIW